MLYKDRGVDQFHPDSMAIFVTIRAIVNRYLPLYEPQDERPHSRVRNQWEVILSYVHGKLNLEAKSMVNQQPWKAKSKSELH